MNHVSIRVFPLHAGTLDPYNGTLAGFETAVRCVCSGISWVRQDAVYALERCRREFAEEPGESGRGKGRW